RISGTDVGIGGQTGGFLLQSGLERGQTLMALVDTMPGRLDPPLESSRAVVHALETLCVCFFFQAEDGIRDFHVTGVQTCALPISAVFLPMPGTRVSRPVSCRVMALARSCTDMPDSTANAVRAPMPVTLIKERKAERS